MAAYGCMSGRIKKILRTRTLNEIEDSGALYKHAGVLMPLIMKDETCSVLFTERTRKVKHHKGQISFPGGRVEEIDDSFGATAIREAKEEIGLSPDDVDVLGQLDDTLTLVSNYLIHPFVGRIITETDFVLNRHEVERVICIPLRIFFSMDREAPDHWVEYEGVRYRTKAYQYKGDLIWGATARIMENFVEIIGPNFPLHAGD